MRHKNYLERAMRAANQQPAGHIWPAGRGLAIPVLRPGWLDYNNLQIFGLSLFQPEYRILKKTFEEKLPKQSIVGLFDCQDEIIRQNIPPAVVVEEMAKQLYEKSDISTKLFESAEDVPDPRELKPEKKNLMIFDDLQLVKQNKCESY